MLGSVSAPFHDGRPAKTTVPPKLESNWVRLFPAVTGGETRTRGGRACSPLRAAAAVRLTRAGNLRFL
jgi:hypothetical protein